MQTKTITILSLTLLATGVAQAMTAGTFTGSAMARNGELAVEVDTTADAIKAVRITKSTETPGIGSLATDALPAAIVEAGSPNVDSVSGATITSKAIVAAVSQALEKAGADPKSMKAKAVKKADAAVSFPTEGDVIIVGGGGAGMVAAATAVGQGAKVIVLEKMAMIGGNTARSEGNMSAIDPEPEKLAPMTPALDAIVVKYINAPVPTAEIKAIQDTVKQQYADYKKSGRTTIFDTPELFALQTLIGGDNKADPKLVLVMAREATRAMQWLDDQSDMTFEHIARKYVDMGIGALYPRAQFPRAKDGVSPISTYDAYIRPLAEKVKAAGSTILTNMKVVDIVKENGRVTGVVAEDKNGTKHTFRASKGVVLAAGGYGANLDMVRKYNKISVTATSNSPGTTGEVLEEAVKDGAALEGMAWIQIHPHGNPVNGDLESNIAGRPQDTPYVNKLGLRFADETGRRDDISHGILAQPGKVAFSIYDQRTVDSKKVRAEHIERAITHGYAYRADTLADLAKMAGIDARGLEQSIKTMNEAAKLQSDKSLSVPKAVIGWTVEQAPFYCVPITVTIHHTMGGLKIDEKTRVLDQNGAPIPGLFAAGEITGGIHGGNRLGRNALTDLLVFGHIAGEEVLK
ncbi:flavocytochrome c [Sutterella sp.]|uniref:flavocytochrome c n=1 Tax=Sutterella sp. TaxID=1981025 RepID=UPI0026E0FBC2|nr:flavocytochrome c [Sutterella sp.]MDO5532410.1 flavocytochrome c [Sutterella sp.]